ncbi:hypothetical protein [Hyalangium minutum]|uniref:Uncharacterized protein n=1 Tax=Hyalangium minutum TaxID=394096 RepID=A0A085WHP4_9BACT|nr:hypothetical protein [Hyalangium minutum]KFE67207.1 hypothetical protein DB31_8560 [Hyalangium minutum]
MTTPSDPPPEFVAEALQRVHEGIQEKLATMPPEEGRKWLERLLARFMGNPVIIETPKPGDDGE